MHTGLDEILIVPDYDTPVKKRRFVERICRKFAAEASRLHDRIENSYLTGVFGKRRRQALLSYLERAEREFLSYGLRSVVEDFTYNELLLLYNYNEIDDAMKDIRVGAALWVLDHLRAAGKLKEAVELLEKVEYYDYEVTAVPPDFHHPCYEDRLIEATVSVLMNRYKMPSIITEENAQGKAPEGNYCQLMGLLPEEAVKKADDTFKAKVWELAARNMKGQAWFDRELMRIAAQLKKAEFGRDALSSSAAARLKNVPAVGPLAKSPLDGINLENPNAMRKLYMGQPVLDDENIFEQPGAVGDYAMRALAREGQDVLSHMKKYIFDFDRFLQMDKKEILKETGSRELAEALAGFTVDDPFEICFALIHLIDSGDDAPWLMRSGSSLVSFAQKMLPWYIDWDEMTDEEWEEWIEGMEYNLHGWMGKEKPLEQIDYYHEKHNGLNLAQIVYRLCRHVVPVGLHPFAAERQKMVAEGMDETRVRKLTDMAEIMFLQSMQAKLFRCDRREDYEEEKLSDEEDEADRQAVPQGEYWGNLAKAQAYDENADKPDEGIDLIAELQKIQKDLLAARKQIKSLREALAENRQEAAREQAESERELKKLRMEHRELADLRQLVFNIQTLADDGDGVKTENIVAYPYETQRRTVVFGGHDSFLKVIKPLLPTVRFVDTENVSFNPEIIRHADVVWIQNNCISHPQYWNIVKYCKLAGVQLRYFAFASAEKCAEQLATEDQK